MYTITILCITFALLGQWFLVILLGTIFCVKSLPQRNNPFLINLLLTTYISTFPPCMLFLTGQQENPNPPHWLCFTQSVLMDGITPLFSMATVVLIFHTWCDLNSKLRGTTPITTSSRWSKYMLLLIPYVTMLSWCIASLIMGLKHPQAQHTDEVYCIYDSPFGTQMRRFANLFLFCLSVIGFYFQACILRIIWLNYTGGVRDISSETYMSTYNTCMRILIFYGMQVLMITLLMINMFMNLESKRVSDAIEMLESLHALCTFLVFGTQKDIWNALKFWQRRNKVESEMQQDKREPELASIV